MDASKQLQSLLDKVPTDDPANVTPLYDTLLKDEAGVAELVALTSGSFGGAGSGKPKYALHGLVVYATRPGADNDRKLVAAQLCQALEGEGTEDYKAFLCRQLQWCGQEENVASLKPLLSDDNLCEPATQALLTIDGEASRDAIQSALSSADGSCRNTLKQAADLMQGV